VRRRASSLAVPMLFSVAVHAQGGASGSRFTVGGEYRLKIESLDAPDFDLRPADEPFTAVGQRGAIHADWRPVASVRAWVELTAATDAGRKPAERSFDRSRPDVGQAYIDLSLPHSTLVRIGRQQLDSGGNRLISTREAANLRLAFDMAHVESQLGVAHVTAFYGRPVLNQRGAFDDRRNDAEKLMGGWITAPLMREEGAPVATAFFLSRDRRIARYQEGTASDQRRTVGARLMGGSTRWDYAFQAARQYGSFGTDDIRAYGFATDIGWHAQAKLSPRVGMSFGIASADRYRDAHLDTFDVIYPNLGYFTDAPVYFPGNTADVQPNLSIEPARSLRLRVGCDAVMRISSNDAVYGPPGVPLLPGTGKGSSFVTAMSYARADWTPEPRVNITVSYVHGSTGSLVRNAGGRDFNYGAVVAGVHF
jgi:hypothetical protein